MRLALSGHSRPCDTTLSLALGCIAFMTLFALSSPVWGGECSVHEIGIPPDSANTVSTIVHRGIGQTFLAADTLITSLTVWRVASEDSNWTIGLLPYFMATDSTGMPDINRILYVGPTMTILSGDGIHPIEFKWTFDPPIALPGPGKYAFFLFQDPCAVYFDILAHAGNGATYPGGELWYTDLNPGGGCSPVPYEYPLGDADIIFLMEFCDTSTTPVRSNTWGELKVRYR
jgi:hypothetical protein